MQGINSCAIRPKLGTGAGFKGGGGELNPPSGHNLYVGNFTTMGMLFIDRRHP